MKIIFTFGEILEYGDWEKFCDEKGYNEYIINEGLVDSSDEVILSVNEISLFELDSYVKRLLDNEII